MRGNKGITLVALIITIIVMLILVGVSVQIVINTNIFGIAERAGEKTKGAYENEQDVKITIGGVEASIDDIVNGYVDHTAEVNEPQLIEGMIPVVYDGSKWVKADTNTNNWYEYGTTKESKRWANAVTVKASGTKTRDYYLSAEAIGKEMAEADILGMYVWIPRYSYKIVRGYHTSNEGNSQADSGFVDIKFLTGTSNYLPDIVEYNEETTANYTKFPDGYVVHPAFNVGNTKLEGIWVAKFEASSSTTTEANPNLGEKYGSSQGTATKPALGGDEITVRPNVTSWRYMNVQNMYIACTNMVAGGNIHGLKATADSHLMKDTEWGAVAYLTQSAYGSAQVSEETGVWNNSYYEGDTEPIAGGATDTADGYTEYGTTKTGMVGIRNGGTNGKNNASDYYSYRTSEPKINADGSITISYQSYQYYSGGTWSGSTNSYTNTYYTYETENGEKGSTTGNIYGIYDMAGGAWEYQASYLNEVNNTYTNYFNTSVPEKHKTTYAGKRASGSMTENGITADGRYFNYMDNKGKYGNAVWETSNLGTAGGGTASWNQDYSLFLYSGTPFAMRGGTFYFGGAAGSFFFHCHSGYGVSNYGFRPVLVGSL